MIDDVVACTPSVSNYNLFDLFNPKFDHSSNKFLNKMSGQI